ncbi:pentatricopeptide repeat-containing protein At1g31430 [Apium graveolens]|uniref:pentatricopeptide repeat-containing protein At1g31430 n=1 Tax=Apium graveolens TaxID=4045 RepID=UPI003D7A4FBB
MSPSRHFLEKSSLKFFTTSSTLPRVSTKTCIHHLKNCKSMLQLKQIQTQLFRICIHEKDDVLSKLIVACTDPKVGNLNYTDKIFYRIKNPSLFVYNVMIKAYTKSGFYKKTVFLFDELRVLGLWPDNFTYPFVFKAVGHLREGLVGEKIHGVVVKCGLEFDCYVCNSVMDMYGALGFNLSLRRVFDEMPERDLVSWNILINGYVRCRMFEDAVEVFRRMQGEVRPDEASVVTTLSACIALKDLELGREIHDYVLSDIGFSVIIGNALLDMYAKCGCIDEARRIFDAMPGKNVICWTSMLSGYVNCGQLDEAKDLFKRSPVKDIVLWTAMINGFVQFNRVDEAMLLFRDMQYNRVKPDKFTVVALLTGCAQVGALEQGKWIHTYIDENRITVDAVAGTALIDMYAKCGCIDKSLEIFYGLKEKDTASWTAIICSLAVHGRTDKALELFTAMKQCGFVPDDITFVGVLTACSHGGLVKEGRQYFHDMKKNYKIEPKLEHYGCMIDLLGRAGLLDEAEETMKMIPDGNKDAVIPLYSALLSACRIYGDVDMGERLADRLVELHSGDSSVHTLLANIYASANRWEDVTEVRRKMRALGVRKEPGCSSIEVDGKVHEFLVGDASHPAMKGILSMLNSIAKPLSGIEGNKTERDNVDSLFCNLE